MAAEQPKRPYRLWNAKSKKALPYRNYKYPRNAHMGALIEARWAEVGVTIEVIDIRNSSLLGQYKRTPTSVAFTQIKKGTDNAESK